MTKGLSSKARALRPCALAILLVTGPASTAPIFGQDACDIEERFGVGGQGIILRFLSKEQAERIITSTQAKMNAMISPQYLTNRRVVIGLANGRRAVALLPNSMTAKPGDRVAFAPAHRDPSWPCAYVPSLVIGLVAPPTIGR